MIAMIAFAITSFATETVDLEGSPSLTAGGFATALSCGELQETTALGDGPIEVWYRFETCRITNVVSRGAWMVETDAERTVATSPLSQSALDEVFRQDVLLARSFGLGAQDVGDGVAAEVAGLTETVDAIPGTTTYHGTKSFIGRLMDGVKSPQSRIVVSRNYLGHVTKVLASWPAVSASAQLTRSSTETADTAEPAIDVKMGIQSIETIVLYRIEDDGTIDVAYRLVEVIRQIRGPVGQRKPQGVLLLDGVEWNATEVLQ
jgi:hypothetical protein